MTIEDINKEIKNLKDEGVSVKGISDTHHTFADYLKERTLLFALVCNIFPEISWKSKKHFKEEEDPMFEGDFLVGLNTPKGVISFHLKLTYWDIFEVPELERAPYYDKYQKEDVFKRLEEFTSEVIEERKGSLNENRTR